MTKICGNCEKPKRECVCYLPEKLQKNKFERIEQGWDGLFYAICTEGWAMSSDSPHRAKELLEEKIKGRTFDN